MAGPGDEIAAAQGQGRGEFRASHADREQVIEVLKAAFVQGRLGKDEFDLRIGRAFAARTHAELAVGRVDVRVPRALAQGFRGRSPHGVALLVYLTTLIYLFILAMTLWLGGAVMVQSWLKRRSGRALDGPPDPPGSPR